MLGDPAFFTVSLTAVVIGMFGVGVVGFALNRRGR
jgi:hypothetical protein